MADITLTLGVDDKGTAILRTFQTTTANTFNKIKGDSESLVDSVKKHWLGLTAAATATGLAINRAWGLAEMAAQFQEQKASLNALATQYGTSANNIISSIQTVSKGLVSMSDAVDIAGSAMTKGLSPDQIINLAGAAETLSNVTGQKVSDAFRSMADSIALGRSRGIEAAVGMIDLKDKYGDLVEKMSEVEKAQAMYAIVMERIGTLQKTLGEGTDSTADKMEGLTVQIADLKLEAGAFVIKGGLALYGILQGTASAALFLTSGVFGIIAALAALSDKLGLTSGGFAKWRLEADAALAAAEELAKKGKENLAAIFAAPEDLAGAAGKKGGASAGAAGAIKPPSGGGDNKAYKDALNDKLAADNKYHLDKWQAETEWAAKERALQGKTIAESLADTSKAIDEEIQMQLHLIDVKEKEGAISPIAAIEERIKWEQSLLAIQEDALKNAEAYTLEWYAAAEAVVKTREEIVGLTKSKLSMAIDILTDPVKAIDFGVRYLADALSSIPEKLQNTWETLKGLFGGDSKEGAAQEKEIQQNKLWGSMGKIGEIILIVKAIANFPKLLADFIKSFMQALFDFPKYFIALFEDVIAKLPRMIFAVLRNFVNSIPAMITAIVNGVYNFVISIVYGLLSWIPGMKLNTNGDSSGLDENTDAVSELQKSIDSLNDSINKQLTDLLTGSDSPASAIDRLQIAWEEVSKAKGVFAGASDEGKVEAGKSLQEALSSYLDVAQEAYQRPSEEYQAIFDSTVSELKAIQAGLAGIDTTDSGSWYSIEFDSSEFTKIFSDAWEGLKKILSDAWESFKALPGKLWEELEKLPGLIAKAIKKALGVGDGGEGQGDLENTLGIDIPGVKWHDGGLLKKAHAGMFVGGGLQSYEVPIIAKVGEGILNDYNGMKAIGGEAGLNYANKTGRMMGGGTTIINKQSYSVSPQVTINTKGEVDTASLVRQIVRATEDSLKYGKMRQMVMA